MKNKFYYLLYLFFIFCFIIFYKGLNNSNTYTPKINKKNIPTFKLKILFKIYINSEKIFDRNILYLNIWASWCVPCRKNILY